MKGFIAGMRIGQVQARLNCYPNEIPNDQYCTDCLIL